jgi:hypothetical protein
MIIREQTDKMKKEEDEIDKIKATLYLNIICGVEQYNLDNRHGRGLYKYILTVFLDVPHRSWVH